MSYIQKTNCSYALRALILAALAFGPLTACTRVPSLPNNVGTQSQDKVSLKVRFEIPETRPDYLAKIKQVEIKLTPASGSVVSDRFDFSPGSDSKLVERTLSSVSQGKLEAEVKFFAADGKEVITALKTSFSLSAATAPLVLKLESTPQILAPAATSPTGSGLTALLTQRRSLLDEIQTLSSRESQLLRQLAGLRTSPNLEDQQMRQQLQAELQVTQTSLRAKESALEALVSQIGGVQAQSSGSSNADAATQAQINSLRLEADKLSADIDSQLDQRRQLSIEANSRLNQADQGTRLTVIQNELQALEQALQVNISRLQIVSLQLQQLESRVSSQSSTLPAAQRKAQIEADLALIRTQISEYETAIAGLRPRIAALAQETDLQLVQRREGLEAELAQKQALLDQAKSLEAELVKQLEAIK